MEESPLHKQAMQAVNDALFEAYRRGTVELGTDDIVVIYQAKDDDSTDVLALSREHILNDPDAPENLKQNVSEPAWEVLQRDSEMALTQAFWFVFINSVGTVHLAVSSTMLSPGGDA